MARDSQRMQVGLIISIMLNVILLAISFFTWRASNEYGKQLDAKNEELAKARAVETSATANAQYLQAMLGSSGSLQALEASGMTMSDELKATKAQFDTDMAQYAQGLPEAERNYRGVAASLLAEIQSLNEQLADANQRINQVLAERDQKVDELTKRVAAAEAGQKKAGDDLMAEKQAFDQERQKYLAQTQADATRINEMTQKVAEVEATAQKQSQTQGQQITELEGRVHLLNQKITDIHDESFEVPHGRIVTVNQLDRSVWVNLGLADGLRPQVTFSVYNADVTTGVEKAKRKARLEVTNVFDQHLAECRIIEDELSDPILRGDVVYSPAWRPSMKVRFALAGFMDINDDGVSDRDLIRNVITMNGGVIDAELHDDGTLTGKLDVGTRFLVQGDLPTESTARENPEAVARYSEMNSAAQRYGIETMKVGELLNLMGWKPEVRTLQLGSGDRQTEGFRPRQPPAANSPQTPPRGEDGGAF